MKSRQRDAKQELAEYDYNETHSNRKAARRPQRDRERRQRCIYKVMQTTNNYCHKMTTKRHKKTTKTFKDYEETQDNHKNT